MTSFELQQVFPGVSPAQLLAAFTDPALAAGGMTAPSRRTLPPPPETVAFAACVVVAEQY